jgi:hypothetical protein
MQMPNVHGSMGLLAEPDEQVFMHTDCTYQAYS